MNKPVGWIAVWLLCVLASPLAAEAPKDRLFLSSLTIARYNPLGLETQGRLLYSKRLVESDSALFGDTFLAPGLSLKLNPACLGLGALVDFQPIAVFHLRVGYEWNLYFGTMGYLRSYPASDADHSDDARKDTAELAYGTRGHRLYAQPALQIKVGKLAARTAFGFEYWAVDLHQGDRYFYDATLDTLVPEKKLVSTNDTDVLFRNDRLAAGLRTSAVFPGTGQSHLRLGPFFAWSFNNRERSWLNKPTLIAILGWYLRHPNRVGAVPYALIGFSFTCDLLPAAT